MCLADGSCDLEHIHSSMLKTQRVMAQFDDIGIAVVAEALGFILKTKADDLEEREDSSGQ